MYWSHIEEYQGRAICPNCNKVEDMTHIILSCRVAAAQETAWKLAGKIWARRSSVLGCGLAAFEPEGKPDKGKNRLYRILGSETAHLVWKLRNEMRIRDGEGPPNQQMRSKTGGPAP